MCAAGSSPSTYFNAMRDVMVRVKSVIVCPENSLHASSHTSNVIFKWLIWMATSSVIFVTWWVNWQCTMHHIQVPRSGIGRCWLTHSQVGPLCWGSLQWSTSTKHSLSLRVYEGVIQIRRNTSTHQSLCWVTNEITCCLYCLNQSLGDEHLLLMHTVHLVWAQVEELGCWWMILVSCVWSVMGTWLIVIVNECGANECDMWVSVSNSGSEYKLV